jgi:predicted nuclease of restriction endonuclease-like RecB superfamily
VVLARAALQPCEAALRVPARVELWTQSYLEKKLTHIKDAGRTDLLICIDAARNAGGDRRLVGLPVLILHKRVDAASVLEWASTAIADRRR